LAAVPQPPKTLMKNSSEYAKNIKKLYRSLKRRHKKTDKVEFDDPIDALVYAVVSENMTESQTQSAIKALKGYFVDWNDLRVAAVEEIIDVIGRNVTASRRIATALVNSLRSVFEKYNTSSLLALRKLGKRPAKLVLEKLADTTPFVVDYCMLTALNGHAIPLTTQMTEYLKANELAHPEADYAQIEGFLARQISSRNAYEFYLLLRHESESGKKTKRSTRESVKKK